LWGIERLIGKPLKSKVSRAIQSLQVERLVKKRRKKWVLAEEGKKEAGKISTTDKQGLLS
jgi:hypothetical protein